MSPTIFSNLWWGLLSKKGTTVSSVMKHLNLNEADLVGADDPDLIDKALEPFGCCLVTCTADDGDSSDDAQLGLAVTVKRQSYWQEPKALPDAMFELDKVAGALALRRAAELLGWEWTEPKWYMATIYC